MTDPRVVLVTGGSRGLGAGLVRGFLAGGDAVATCSRSRTPEIDSWESGPESARFLYAELDLADRPSIDAYVHAVVERFGRIDVLVNNAGVAREGVLALFGDDDTDMVIDLNVKGTLHISRLVVRRMLSQGDGGRIVNISSIVGLSGYRGLSVYGASKAALDGFTRALARELGSRAITVNSVAPGYLATEMSQTLAADQLDQIVRRTPAGRLGDASDVYAAVRFLASPEASFITGHVLVVDGGLTA